MADSQTKKIYKRVKVPTVLQMEAVECGAACLTMILGAYKRYEPLEKIRIECGVSRDGSKASNVLKAARKYGLEAKGYRKDNIDELNNFPFPMIVHWNFNHFIVLEGIKGNKVYINDPGTGPKILTKQEFDLGFTGIILVFKKTEKFQPGGQKKSMLKSLFKRLQGSKFVLLYVILAGLALVIPGLIIPVFLKVFIDKFLILQMESWVKPLLIGMFLTAILRSLLGWFQQYYLLRLETKISLVNSSKFLWHILRLPIEFFTQRYAGEIGSRVQINDKVASIISGKLAETTINLITIIFYAAIMFYYDAVLTVIGIATIFLNFVVMKIVSKRRIDKSQKLIQDNGRLMGVSMGGLQSIETLKSTGGESDFFSKWSGTYTKVVNDTQELSSLNATVSVVPNFLNYLNTILILSIGGLRVMNGEITIGMLVAFQSLMMSFTAPITELVNMGNIIQELEGDMNRLDDVLKYDIDNNLKQDNQLDLNEFIDSSGIKLSGNIEIKNLTFGYSILEPPLIENFNLKLEPGKRVALIGGSGSGKSTIAKLITGLYEPWSGEILFDGKKRNEIPREILSDSLSLVDQEIFLFHGTIRENLTMWENTVKDKNIVQSAKDACIHDIIAARPNGYDNIVEEGGANFSGGQRQRLEIARALIDDPTILILDEATSALDPATEEIIDKNLRRRGCSCIIVAHRLSTIRDCDEIIVLNKGKVVQRGTHEEMKNIDGMYSELIKM